MNTTTFQDQLREQLHRLFPDFKETSNKQELMINCPICAKEGRIDKGYHMYISLGYNNKPPMYNCFKNSNHRGLLTESFLEQYSINPQYIDKEIISNLNKYNSKMSDLGRYRLNKNNKFNFITPYPINNQNTDLKLNYINKRLGINLSLEDIKNLKIILNIKDFLMMNNINKITRSQYTIDLLNEYFVGFLTNNNTSIILRNLVKDRNLLPEIVRDRYIKYSIVNGYPAGYYTIPSKCDIYKPINIHIAEGTFDILSVYCNLRKMNNIQNIYSSIGGNSYLNTIKYFICDCAIVDPIFHIYIDNDINKDILDKIKYAIRPLGIDVYIHINTFNREKDFGVDLAHIKEFTYKL